VIPLKKLIFSASEIYILLVVGSTREVRLYEKSRFYFTRWFEFLERHCFNGQFVFFLATGDHRRISSCQFSLLLFVLAKKIFREGKNRGI